MFVFRIDRFDFQFDKIVKNFESTSLHLHGISRVSEPDLNMMSCDMS